MALVEAQRSLVGGADGELEVLDALLQKGVSPDTRGRSEEPAIVRATRAQDETAIKHLLDAAATVMNLLLLQKTDVRHGDYHVILRKR